MKLSRVVRMRPSELSDRLRQEQLKLLERLRIVGPGREPAIDADAARALLERFRRRAVDRFFRGAVDARTAALVSSRSPDARAAVLAAAARSLAGRFDLLGYRELHFGDPIEWRLDPISGTRSKLEHWTRIDPLDRRGVGDHKVVWELNRQQWLLHWAQAYAFTGDERYAERSLDALEQWMRANPPGLGVNWASSLELALRLISWCWTLVLVRESPALHPERFARVLHSVHAHATQIARYLSTTFSPNTHLLGEALALLYAGVLFADFERAAAWRTAGQAILHSQIERQILTDGVCFEQATCYQRYTAEMYMHFLILAARSDIAVPPHVVARVQRCIGFLLAIRRSDGSVPQIGDGDGGWLLPLLPREADDMRGVFGVAAALFGRADYAEAAGGPVLEAAWLLGADAVQAQPTHRPTEARGDASRLFADGGYAVLRSDHGPAAHQLTVDVGPLGCPISGAHGHADLLGVTCDIFGEPCIVDPGMPTYGGDASWRDAFRSTALHSSVVIDGASQAVPAGTFAWKHRPRARVRDWRVNDGAVLIDGEHDAYQPQSGVVHRRRVVFIANRYWVIVDDLRASRAGAPHRIEICFQLAPGCRVNEQKPWVRIVTPRGHALLVRASAAVSLETAVHEGEHGPLPIRGWFSPAYGRVQPAPNLVFHAVASVPLRIVTVLLPCERADAEVPASFPPESDSSLLQRALA